MIMEPVEVFSVAGFPGEVGRPRMLHEPPVGITFVGGRIPSPTAVTTVAENRMTIDAAINNVDRTIAQHREALLRRNGAAARGRAQTHVAFR